MNYIGFNKNYKLIIFRDKKCSSDDMFTEM